jgi:endonuclease/exonuclease/phosphatase family metal-dependent hydrolase
MTAPNNSNASNGDGVRITQRQIYDVVTKMERDLIALVEVKESVQDHETRIRDLERAVWKSSWISGLIAAIVTSASTAVIMRLLTTI